MLRIYGLFTETNRSCFLSNPYWSKRGRDLLEKVGESIYSALISPVWKMDFWKDQLFSDSYLLLKQKWKYIRLILMYVLNSTPFGTNIFHNIAFWKFFNQFVLTKVGPLCILFSIQVFIIQPCCMLGCRKCSYYTSIYVYI